jgi:hypothetical protein
MQEKKCILCFEYINDPICVYCYMNQIKIWLRDKKINIVIRKYLLNKIKNKLSIESINDIRCIICKDENVNLCFYCFSKIIINMMNELNFEETLLDDFSNSFNYNSSEYDVQIAKRNGYYIRYLKDNDSVRGW